MSVKKEVLKQKCILFKIDFKGNIKEEIFEEIFYYYPKESYSVMDGDWSYYCKGKNTPFYATYNYCLLVNLEYRETAIKTLTSNYISSLESTIKSCDFKINRLKNEMEDVKIVLSNFKQKIYL